MGSLPEHTFRVLEMFDQADVREVLYWSVNDGVVRFWVICNDMFAWGCADAEDITDEDLPALEQAFTDAKEVGEVAEFPTLYAARRRGMRPQGAMYKCLPEVAWPLYDAAGPHRERSLMNPFSPLKEPKEGGDV
jgi:hypothetical protein